MTYTVSYIASTIVAVTVEANSEEEAMELGRQTVKAGLKEANVAYEDEIVLEDHDCEDENGNVSYWD